MRLGRGVHWEEPSSHGMSGLVDGFVDGGAGYRRNDDATYNKFV
jgi:hypothetical protein